MSPRWVPMTPEERFHSRTTRGEGCWSWQGYVGAKGYGLYELHGVSMQAHRAAWIIANGPIPKGMCVCHECDNPRCVRPDHLWLGTNAENTRDRDIKGRCRAGAHLSARTHCANGHEYTPENTRTTKGYRECRTCGRDSRRQYLTRLTACGGESKRPLKAKCARGHDYSPENTYILKSGARQCRECKKIARAKYNSQRRPSFALDYPPQGMVS